MRTVRRFKIISLINFSYLKFLGPFGEKLYLSYINQKQISYEDSSILQSFDQHTGV